MSRDPKMIVCRISNNPMAAKAKLGPSCDAQIKKPIYKKWCFGLIVVLFVIGAALSGGTKSYSSVNVPSDKAENKPSQVHYVPSEYKSALKKADTYSSLMHMSKAAIYDQLVSEYGEQFSEDAAQYAIDNLTADWKANALAKAESYQEMMSMSPRAIYDQLVSEYGEKFTAEEAQYAIDNLK